MYQLMALTRKDGLEMHPNPSFKTKAILLHQSSSHPCLNSTSSDLFFMFDLKWFLAFIHIIISPLNNPSIPSSYKKIGFAFVFLFGISSECLNSDNFYKFLSFFLTKSKNWASGRDYPYMKQYKSAWASN